MRKLDNPTTCPACYSIDLYCNYEADHHEFDEFPHQFLGETYAQCARQARKLGWMIYSRKLATATCPKCVKALKGKGN